MKLERLVRDKYRRINLKYPGEVDFTSMQLLRFVKSEENLVWRYQAGERFMIYGRTWDTLRIRWREKVPPCPQRV